MAGHAGLDARQRYLHNTAKMVAVPAAAVPSIRVLPQLVAKPRERERKTKKKKPDFSRLFQSLRGGDSTDVPRGFLDNSRGTGRVSRACLPTGTPQPERTRGLSRDDHDGRHFSAWNADIADR